MKEIEDSKIAVFSTYVEVILYKAVGELEQGCVLHVCGGDPYASSRL